MGIHNESSIRDKLFLYNIRKLIIIQTIIIIYCKMRKIDFCINLFTLIFNINMNNV